MLETLTLSKTLKSSRDVNVSSIKTDNIFILLICGNSNWKKIFIFFEAVISYHIIHVNNSMISNLKRRDKPTILHENR